MIATRDYRSKAIECAKNAREASDRMVRREWEALAIRWHWMATTGEASLDGR
jgi:hypothetical protein